MKLRLWPKDATTLGEKISHVACILFVAGLYLFLQLSAWQVFHNDFQAECKAAPVIFHALGGVLTVLSITGIVLFSKDVILKNADRIVGGIATAVLTALTFLSYAGFYAYTY